MTMGTHIDKSGQHIADLTPVPQHPALQSLVSALRARYGENVVAVLFYGSCLRSGDPYDGLVDLYLIVDRYREANSSLARAMWNGLLPPNVFYTEVAHEAQTVRCKYAVLTLTDLQRGTSRRWFHSYLWGRFCQPVAIAWHRDTDSRQQISHCLLQAVTTFLQRALPALSPEGNMLSLWRDGLTLSYRTELRPESANRAGELVAANLSYYETVTGYAATTLAPDFRLEPSATDLRYRTSHPAPKRFVAKLAWKLRSLQGKLLSVARLLKALFTFDGGLDYIAWKLERHSGVSVEIPDRVRRWPLIFIWGMFWDLYRRGAFR
ncbi:FIG00687856: Predicted nucleotidyltransferases [hydrothermal vent metagenome]|uniref:FIG00687856: Predicted nucleotidyltransferases n=1 Tax=hydrothermal vent metagenome TaxID=652676 RepID=A0A3B0Z7Z8_9ZZZZ